MGTGRGHDDGRREALRRLNLLAGCSDDQLGRIHALTCAVGVSPGRVLARGGRRTTEVFLVLEGAARVNVDETEFATLSPGASVGAAAALYGGRHPATVTSITPMSLLVATPSEYRSLLTTVPQLVSPALQERRLWIRIVRAEAVRPSSGGARLTVSVG